MRTAAETVQAAAAVAVRSVMVMDSVVMRMPMDVVRHMMSGGVVRPRMVMHGGRGRRSEDQRRHDDDRQSRDDFTHERLHEERFQ
jgi:hypothetical protein